jgi:hypothetical protein
MVDWTGFVNSAASIKNMENADRNRQETLALDREKEATRQREFAASFADQHARLGLEIEQGKQTMALNQITLQRAELAKAKGIDEIQMNAQISEARQKMDQVEREKGALGRLGEWSSRSQDLYKAQELAMQPSDLLGSLINLDTYKKNYSADPYTAQAMSDRAALAKAGHGAGLPSELVHPGIISESIVKRFGKIEMDLTEPETKTVTYGRLPDPDSATGAKQDYSITTKKKVAWTPDEILLKAQSGTIDEKRVAMRMLIQASNDVSKEKLPDFIKANISGDLAPLGLNNYDERLPDLFDEKSVSKWDNAIKMVDSVSQDPAVAQLRPVIQAARRGDPVAIAKFQEMISQDNPSTRKGIELLVWPTGEPPKAGATVQTSLRGPREEAISYAFADDASKAKLESEWKASLKASGLSDQDSSLRISLMKEMADSVKDQYGRFGSVTIDRHLRAAQKTLLNTTKAAGYVAGQIAAIPLTLANPVVGFGGGLAIGYSWDKFIDESMKRWGIDDLGARTGGEVAMDIIQGVAFSGGMSPVTSAKTVIGEGSKAVSIDDYANLSNVGTLSGAIWKSKMVNSVRSMMGWKSVDPLDGFKSFKQEQNVADELSKISRLDRLLEPGTGTRQLPKATLKTREAALQAEQAARDLAEKAKTPFPGIKTQTDPMLPPHEKVVPQKFDDFKLRVQQVMEKFQEVPKVDPRMRNQRNILDRSVNENLVNSLRQPSRRARVNGKFVNPEGDLFVVDKQRVPGLVRDAQNLVDELLQYSKATPGQVRDLLPSHIMPKFGAWFESVKAEHGEDVAQRLLVMVVKLGGI